VADAKGIKAGRAYVEVGADKSQFDKQLRAAQSNLASWGAGLVAIGRGITMPLERFGGMAAERGRDLLFLAQETGTTVEEISALGFAARRTGASSEGMEAALTHVNRVVAEASTGAQGANEHLERLGLTFNDLASLSTTQRFLLIADRIGRIQDAGVRAGMAVSILGRRGKELVPLFSRGAAGIQSLMTQAAMLGRVITTKEAEDARAFGFELTAIADGLKTATLIIAGGLLPGLRAAFAGDKDIAAAMVSAARATANWLRENKELVKTLFNVGLYTAWAGAGLLVVNHLLPTLALGFKGLAVATGLWALAVQVGVAPLWALVAGLIAGAAISVLFLDRIGQLDYVLGLFGDVTSTMGGDFARAWRGIKDAIAGGDLEGAFRVLTTTLGVEWVRFTNMLSNTWSAWAAIFRHIGVDIAADFANVWARITSLTEAGYERQRQLNEQARGRSHRAVDDILDATVGPNQAALQAALSEQADAIQEARISAFESRLRARAGFEGGPPGTAELTQAGHGFVSASAQEIMGQATGGNERIVGRLDSLITAVETVTTAVNNLEVGGIAVSQ